jgi:hypothetical protein
MSINVYWSCLENEWLRAQPPVPVYENFLKKNEFKETNIVKCPSFTLDTKNLYGIKSLYTYNFILGENTVSSGLYDQPFFDRHVMIRSLQERVFSFLQYYTFFTDSDSLLMSANIQPYLETNNPINDRCMCFSGAFDIGKWYRNIEFSFHLKDQFNEFLINENEIYCYIKFHTNEKINFIQHRHSPALASHLSSVIAAKNYKLSTRNLFSYYKMFNTKKMIIKEIKNNII